MVSFVVLIFITVITTKRYIIIIWTIKSDLNNIFTNYIQT